MMASAIIWGMRPLGHTVVQRPQWRQVVSFSSACSTSSSRSTVMALVVLVMGTSRVLTARPIMGPPEMTFLGSTPSLRPPAASIISAKLVPSRAMKLEGFLTPSPVTVITWRNRGRL